MNPSAYTVAEYQLMIVSVQQDIYSCIKGDSALLFNISLSFDNVSGSNKHNLS
jgi:hypothetical protein